MVTFNLSAKYFLQLYAWPERFTKLCYISQKSLETLKDCGEKLAQSSGHLSKHGGFLFQAGRAIIHTKKGSYRVENREQKKRGEKS